MAPNSASSGPGDRASGSGPSHPSGPSSPGAGPSTPGPSGPGTGPTTGGPYIPKSRGPTTRTELEIQWDHPVPPKAAPGDPERTVAIVKRALPFEEALAVIRGNDPRPLLVVRECVRCSGTEDALLRRMEDNERTFLMSRWFHCVK